jgi:dTDP-glucose pyrophosphorylase
VQQIEVKNAFPNSSLVWGAFKMPGAILHQLHELWCKRERADEYIGTLVNAYLAEGGEAFSVPAGEVYVDVGTLNGYREAMHVLSEQTAASWEQVRC